jgi:predicted nucleic acid-binding Zn ribbon protein
VRFSALRPIEDEVRRELARFGPAAGLGDIVAAWPECVGAGIAANAWPARLARDGSLHVSTSSSAWAFELTQLASSILERLQERLGESAPASLRFAPGPLPEAGPEPVEASKRTVPKASEADRAEGARIAATIENPDLREAVARAAEASLAAGTNRSI